MARFLLVVVLAVFFLLLLHPAPSPTLGAGFGEAGGTIDITKILSSFPEFSTLSGMLNETNVAFAINSLDKATLLAPNNTAVAAAFGGMKKIPRSFLADLLALHVVLDYIDEPRLGALIKQRAPGPGQPQQGQGSVVTTLLQAMRPGAVPRGAAFLRVFSGADGRATVSSAAAPAGGNTTTTTRNATVVRVVAAQPNSVAVLQVSGFVVPPGIRVPMPMPFPPPTPRARHMSAPPPAMAPAPAAAAPGHHRHVAAPPGQAPAAAPGPRQDPFVGSSGPLVPSPVRPVPSPNLTNNAPPPALVETGVIPIPGGHGGMAAKLPSAAAGRSAAASWWTGVAVAIGIVTCMNLHL